MMMMMRRTVATAVRRQWISPQPASAYRCNSVRWIKTGGTMIEAEIVSPLKNDLQEALQKHNELVASDKASESIQSSLEMIRNLRFQMEEWEESLETEQELHKQFYRTPLDLAKSHNRFGILHQQLGQYDESQRHFEKSLQYYQQLHPDTFHPQVGEAFNALATLASQRTELGLAMKNLHLAEPHFRYPGKHMFDSLDLTPESEPSPDPGLRQILENQGQLMRSMNQHREALVLYREIEGRLMENGESVDRDLLLSIADCLMALDNPKEAQKLYQLVLQRYEVEPDSLMAAAIHHQLGLVYCAETTRTSDQEAVELFSIAYRLRKRLLGDTHLLVGKTANAMGVVQASLDNPGSALTNFREALVIARIHSEFPDNEDDPEVKLVLKNISMVQRDMEQSTFRV